MCVYLRLKILKIILWKYNIFLVFVYQSKRATSRVREWERKRGFVEWRKEKIYRLSFFDFDSELNFYLVRWIWGVCIWMARHGEWRRLIWKYISFWLRWMRGNHRMIVGRAEKIKFGKFWVKNVNLHMQLSIVHRCKYMRVTRDTIYHLHFAKFKHLPKLLQHFHVSFNIN